jgi:hypothetical protein
VLTAALQDWLAARPKGPTGPGRPTVSGVRMPESGGLSSTSLLFEASWAGQATERRGCYVARMAPEASAVPVFPSYDLPAQFEVISRVAARCDIPLPKLRSASSTTSSGPGSAASGAGKGEVYGALASIHVPIPVDRFRFDSCTRSVRYLMV